MYSGFRIYKMNTAAGLRQVYGRQTPNYPKRLLANITFLRYMAVPVSETVVRASAATTVPYPADSVALISLVGLAPVHPGGLNWTDKPFVGGMESYDPIHHNPTTGWPTIGRATKLRT